MHSKTPHVTGPWDAHSIQVVKTWQQDSNPLSCQPLQDGAGPLRQRPRYLVLLQATTATWQRRLLENPACGERP